ncbi:MULTISPECIES: transglycosylase SLT domain-containing protein [Acidiphilium]|uniref:transglycosylase SLT domain-containing protein n=1 Tax=Acidiphilium TaxID=522 RepID=UPI00258BD2DE|nr:MULTISPECIES: transglycosylase SLT domain-containing protein [Acidiphilium]HQT86261.1 transglycosylase SLT domain-containing protein [Acidiphilium rubrum]
MTDNTLRVKITAQDRAAKVIEDLENRIKRLRPPTMQAAGAMGHVNETTTRLERFAKGRTLPLASEHLRRISRDAFGAFRNIGRLSAEMGGLGEVLAGGTVLGGLAAAAILTKRWADQGMRLGNMSANIGITSGQLIRMQRVGAMTGVSSEAVAGSLTHIGLSEFDAKYANDPKAVTAYRQLGIHVGTRSGQIVSPVKVLEEVADKIKGFTPQGQIRAVENLGLSPDILPLLRMGGKGIELAAAKLKAQGLTTDAYAGSTKLYKDFWKLDNAAIELSNTMAKRVEPALDDAVRGLTWFVNFLNGGSPVPPHPTATLPDVRNPALAMKNMGGPAAGARAAPLPPGIGAQVRAQAKLRGLDPAWMTALARQEGGTGKVSSAGAIGTMQLMPGTAAMEGVNPYNQKQNVVGGEGYFQQLLERYHGNYAVATAAYNAGPANPGVRWFAETGSMSRLPDQTKQYVANIEAMHKRMSANALPPSVQAAADAAQARFDAAHVHLNRAGTRYVPNAAPPRSLDTATPRMGAPRTLDPSVLSELSNLRAQKGSVKVDINHTNAPPGTTTRASASGAASMGGLRISTAMPNQAYP